MRKLVFAALICAAAFASSPAVQAEGLSTKPGADSAMLIPTYAGATATLIPIDYWGRHRHWHHRHWYHHHWAYW